MVEVVRMSSKGQLVVPRSFREKLGLKPSDLFAVVLVRDGVFFKRISVPDVEREFKELTSVTEREFCEKGVRKRDVVGAVKWARRE